MRLLKEINSNDYDTSLDIIKREACRAIYYKNGKVGMIKSERHNYYKFPGGGRENNETLIDTLIRETKEETGMTIKPNTIEDFGYVVEKRKSLFEDKIFLQYSYYYLVDVEEKIGDIHLVDYEIEEKFKLVFVTPIEAIKENMLVYKKYKYTFLERENYILKLIKNIK